MKKLIVDRHQARKIKDGKCELVFNMRRKQGYTMEHLATKKFMDQVFWVAEPKNSIINEETKERRDHFSCDQVPDGFRPYTVPTAGSRIWFGEHRHTVKCTAVEVIGFGSGDMFSVLVTLEQCSD